MQNAFNIANGVEDTVVAQLAASESVAASRSSNTGNPPIDTADQITRLAYVQGVVNRDYSHLSPRNRGTYTVYLYLSHFIDNSNYVDSSNNGFEDSLSHIISVGDVEVYDSFMNVSRYNNFVRQITSFGIATYDLASSYLSIKETMQSASEKTWKEIASVRIEAENAGESATEIASSGKQVFDAINNNIQIQLSNGVEKDQLEARVIADEVFLSFEATANTGTVFQKTIIDTIVGALLGTLIGASPFLGIAVGAASVVTQAFNSIIDVAAVLAMRQSINGRIIQRRMIDYGWGTRPIPPNI